MGDARESLRGRGNVRVRHIDRPIFIFKHRGGTVKAWNECFSADLSGARPRRWKSEFLSIACGFSEGRSSAFINF